MCVCVCALILQMSSAGFCGVIAFAKAVFAFPECLCER